MVQAPRLGGYYQDQCRRGVSRSCGDRRAPDTDRDLQVEGSPIVDGVNHFGHQLGVAHDCHTNSLLNPFHLADDVYDNAKEMLTRCIMKFRNGVGREPL